MVKSGELAIDIILDFGGHALPSKKDLMARYGCSYLTVTRAINALEARHFIVNKVVVARLSLNA